jgi:predicted acyltransferase
MSEATPFRTAQRIDSLDQFRGYTVFGMFLVNFVGGFQACHYVLQHHNTFCSYADTIMPQFLFAVGFAFRLTFTRRAGTMGSVAAYLRVVRRLLGLVLVALIVYTVDAPADSWSQLQEIGIWGAIQEPLKRDWFQTLTHIAVTSLWILPVIRAGAATRIAFMIASAATHLILSSLFYFHWVNGQPPPNGIDGGPLGFLTWTIPAIVGTLACDMIAGDERRPPLFPLLFWAAVLMGLGYLLSCGTRFYDLPPETPRSAPHGKLAADPVLPPAEARSAAWNQTRQGQWKTLLAEPPFVPPPHPAGQIGESHHYRQWNYWMMSQRAGTLSYLTFSAGFSLAVYTLFYVLCDLVGWQLGVFRTFGTNALVAYVLHMMVASAVKPFMPRDVPAWYMWVGCALFMGVTYLIVRTLEKRQIYIRL